MEMEGNPLVRLPCDLYDEEFRACIGWRGRFNQYFVYGKYADCTKWREDFLACSTYLETGDKTKLTSIINNEHERKELRRKLVLANDAWEYRKEPPKEWFEELPSTFKSPLLDATEKELSPETLQKKTKASSFLEKLYSKLID